MYSFNAFGGLEVVIQKPVKVEVKRSWFERLTKRPLFKKTKIVSYQKLEDGQTIIVGNKIHMNEATFEAIRKGI